MSARLFSRLSFSCTPEQEDGEELRAVLWWHFGLGVFKPSKGASIGQIDLYRDVREHHPKRYSNYFSVVDSPDCGVFPEVNVMNFNTFAIFLLTPVQVDLIKLDKSSMFLLFSLCFGASVDMLLCYLLCLMMFSECLMKFPALGPGHQLL